MARAADSGAARVRRRNQLVEAHFHLIEPIAQRLRSSLPASIRTEDLEQEGALGLLAAAERFDAGRGVPFAAYARLRIRGAMLDWVRQQWRPALTLEIEADPVDRRARADEQVIEFQAAAAVQRAIGEMISPRQRELLELRLAGLTQRDAGRRMGISQEGARQLELRAVKRIRKLVA